MCSTETNSVVINSVELAVIASSEFPRVPGGSFWFDLRGSF